MKSLGSCEPGDQSHLSSMMHELSSAAFLASSSSVDSVSPFEADSRWTRNSGTGVRSEATPSHATAKCSASDDQPHQIILLPAASGSGVGCVMTPHSCSMPGRCTSERAGMQVLPRNPISASTRDVWLSGEVGRICGKKDELYREHQGSLAICLVCTSMHMR